MPERPEQLIVYGGIGKAARNWECFDAIVATLKRLKNDETLLVQSGKPVGVFRTHENAPRVLIANANLVPHWATWDEFRRLDALGLTMYGQMTAGSWIYIGTQGILQGTYECFAAVARQRFDNSLRGKLVVTAGLGGMGGAQPLAATMNEATALIAEVDRSRIQRRLDKRYLDEEAPSLDAAITRALEARDAGEAVSIGVVANAVDLLEALLARGIVPDVLTDQTSAHDELTGYVPAGMSYEQAIELREVRSEKYVARSYETMARHMRAMIELQRRGAITFDYGNNLRGQALKAGVTNAFDVGGFVPLFIRPLFCEGKGPFRWAALSGDPERHLRHRRRDPQSLSARQGAASLDPHGAEARRVPGAAGAHLLARLRRARQGRAALQSSSSPRRTRLRADRHRPRPSRRRLRRFAEPRDRGDEGRVGRDRGLADPQRAAQHVAGATWVSFHHGGGVGIGYSIHAGMVIVADGTAAAAERLTRVLMSRPRHRRHASRRRRLRGSDSTWRTSAASIFRWTALRAAAWPPHSRTNHFLALSSTSSAPDILSLISFSTGTLL